MYTLEVKQQPSKNYDMTYKQAIGFIAGMNILGYPGDWILINGRGDVLATYLTTKREIVALAENSGIWFSSMTNYIPAGLYRCIPPTCVHVNLIEKDGKVINANEYPRYANWAELIKEVLSIDSSPKYRFRVYIPDGNCYAYVGCDSIDFIKGFTLVPSFKEFEYLL